MKLYIIGGAIKQLSTSIGFILSSKDGLSAEQLMWQFDQSMYKLWKEVKRKIDGILPKISLLWIRVFNLLSATCSWFNPNFRIFILRLKPLRDGSS
jgi:hypothetical protein|tara:strand:- start:136 stop:423 length:288 start_codon:yes stop_codon:yes gene_type:complete